MTFFRGFLMSSVLSCECVSSVKYILTATTARINLDYNEVMARFDYSGVRGTAARLIERFGQTATLRKTSTDPASPSYAPVQTRADYSVEVVRFDESERDEKGSLTGKQVRMLMMAVKSGVPAPSTGDEIVIGERVERVWNVSPLEPGGTAVFYKVLLEG